MIKSLDPERITKLISSMRESVKILYEIRALPETEFFSDIHKQASAKYHFIIAIEAAIDIASHVISRRGFRAPEDYGDTFRTLAENGVLEAEFAAELVMMARFRNRLVHLYWDVDLVEIWKILQSRLEDFENYITQIGSYLRSLR